MSSVTSIAASEFEQLILAQLAQVRLPAARMHRRRPRHAEIDGRISAGAVGLIQAVDRFQPERHSKVNFLPINNSAGLRSIQPASGGAATFRCTASPGFWRHRYRQSS
jgi:hypothetical protein